MKRLLFIFKLHSAQPNSFNKLNYMRKIIISLVLLTIFATPLAALALEGPQECCKLKRSVELPGVAGSPFAAGKIVGETTAAVCGVGTVDTPTPNWGMLCILNTLNGIVDWTFTILIILAVFFTILGAWTMITAGGKAENMTKGKDFILYAAIGLAVGFLAKALPGIVRSISGF